MDRVKARQHNNRCWTNKEKCCWCERRAVDKETSIKVETKRFNKLYVTVVVARSILSRFVTERSSSTIWCLVSFFYLTSHPNQLGDNSHRLKEFTKGRTRDFSQCELVMSRPTEYVSVYVYTHLSQGGVTPPLSRIRVTFSPHFYLMVFLTHGTQHFQFILHPWRSYLKYE